MSISIDKIGENMYRLIVAGQEVILSAADVLTIMEYGLRWAGQLEREKDTMQEWRAIVEQSQQDLAAIQTDKDAYAFIDKYFSKDLRHRYYQLYRSNRHEMLRTPRQAIDNLLSLPPLE